MMRRLLLLLLPLVCVVCLTTADEPSEQSISTNFDARHHHHGGDGDEGNKKAVVKKGVHFSAHGYHYKRAENRGVPRVKRATATCDSSYNYRSIDGTCNNLNNPSWGSVDQPFQRLLDPVYEGGSDLPRLKQTDGNYLPSPRDISVEVHDFDISRPHPRGSVMLMEWGQFLAHDVVGTPVDEDALTGDCCNDDLVTGSSLHSDVETGGPCFPIIISEGDRYFTSVSTRCMEFVRSYPVPDSKGVRQQKNKLSAYIDGTNVYGTDDDEMKALRSFSGGKLKVLNGDDLPKSADNYCISTDPDDYCLEAGTYTSLDWNQLLGPSGLCCLSGNGDSRVNVYPGLGALHTIFMRYHNYVAGELAASHTDYNDETLFQEARKIVIAVIQSITYNEYLPMIIGNTAMNTYGLNDNWSYDDTCDATLYNVFATAAFRFGHSMVPDALLINGVNVSSVNLYNRPYYVLNHFDSLVKGLLTQHAQQADRWYSEGLTDQLFEESPQEGFDVASLNIQRGRDHGLPSYNEWRNLCGLGKLSSFDDMNFSRRYGRAYDDINDVDLYSGALSEQRAGAVVGPTFACLLGRQFAKLRNCDRFWWENTDPNIGFASNNHRTQIDRVKLSHIICLTTGMTEAPRSAFRVMDSSNPAQPCTNLLRRSLDVSLF